MKFAGIALLCFFAGCSSQTNKSPSKTAAGSLARKSQPDSVAQKEGSAPSALSQARSRFTTAVIAHPSKKIPPPQPPAEIFARIKYQAPTGPLWAYVTPDPHDGKTHPAILWITGGDCNSIDDLWSPAPRENDQTAAAYRKAGVVTMFASLRGGNDNPGSKEYFLGEVDDVLAAAEHLEQLSYVDADRIYLGGHSTGGTLALLVAECSNHFRAVFCFGPAADVLGYGPDYVPFSDGNLQEIRIRSPGYWLDSIKSPVFVLEGTVPTSNIASLRAMAQISKNTNVHFVEVQGVNHFSILAPANEVIAKKILQDSGALSLNAKDFDIAASQ